MSNVKRYRAGDFVPVTSVAASDFDAQRLRADTAEAKAADYLLAWGKCAELRDAAEQRIADLKSVLERMLEDDDMPVHWFAQRIDAALNQKSEGESQ